MREALEQACAEYAARYRGYIERIISHECNDGEYLWFWLDRVQDRLYGPDLADKLTWFEADDVLQGQWTPDVVVLRITERNEEVHREEGY